MGGERNEGEGGGGFVKIVMNDRVAPVEGFTKGS